ncbi:MAG: hypothetical protein GW949_06420 [Spirochaetales bacterium]|nr:hypothetical protein [Spirochaetales bacterium]
MDRLACISLPQLPLQLVLRQNPEWYSLPTVTIRDERPTSPVLYANPLALKEGIRPGIRYSEALSLVRDLRAGVASPDQTRQARNEVAALLEEFTPEVEMSSFDPEVIWANLSGLEKLFGSYRSWIVLVQKRLKTQGLGARVVVGYTRLGSYIFARIRKTSLVLDSFDLEQRGLANLPLTVLPLAVSTLGSLDRLGVRNLHDLLKLPRDGLFARFGKEAKNLLEFLDTDRVLPLQPLEFSHPLDVRRRLDSPIFSLPLLLPHLHQMLEQLSLQSEGRRSLIAQIELLLGYESGDEEREVIRPAQPGRRVSLFLRLLELRLENRSFRGGIETLQMVPEEVILSPEQLELFASRERQASATAQGFSLLRARFGNQAVQVATLEDSHLPEATFSWRSISEVQEVDRSPLSSPTPDRASHHPSTAVRRLIITPKPIPKPSLAARIAGPFLLSGGWWNRQKASTTQSATYQRHYYYFWTPQGDLGWGYQDQETGRWILQGYVD